MSVLKPYIDSGKLVVRSKQMGMDKVGTLRWDGAVAQARMDNLLSAFYGKDKQCTRCCRPMTACRSASCPRSRAWATARRHAALPVVSGQDAEIPSVKSILKGEQYSTVFKDTRELAKVTANMVDAVLAGGSRRSTTPRPTTTA
jgi:putative multiple sugar transport system substrate-binding protein